MSDTTTQTNGHRLTDIPSDINSWSKWGQVTYFRNHGCIIHPLYPVTARVDSPGKRPKLSEEQRKKITDIEFYDFFGNGADNNVGIMPYGGHVIIDLDSKFDKGQTVREFIERNPRLSDVPREQTAGGVHLHVRLPSIPALYKRGRSTPYTNHLVQKELWHGMSAELYWRPPHNVVLSPSLHKSGHQYSWAVFGEIPVWTWQDIVEVFQFSDYTTTPGTGPGRPSKSDEYAWKYQFIGDLRTLDIKAMLQEKQLGQKVAGQRCSR